MSVEVALLTGQVVTVGEAAAQVDKHTTAFLESYRPEVKLGSPQRYGAVKDELRQAIRMPRRRRTPSRPRRPRGVAG